MYRYSTEISLYYFIDSFTRIFKELLRELYRPRFAHNASYFILTDFLNNSVSILQNQALWFFLSDIYLVYVGPSFGVHFKAISDKLVQLCRVRGCWRYRELSGSNRKCTLSKRGSEKTKFV